MKRTNRRSKQTTATENAVAVVVGDDKQGYEKRIEDLEKENKSLKEEVEELRNKLANSPTGSSESQQKRERGYLRKLNVLEDKVMELQSKLHGQSQRSVQRPKTDEAVKRLQDEIQILKAQKVQLLCKMKFESVQFRICKASLEKEVLQLKKEGWRHKYEIQKRETVNEAQKKVLHRKTEEASMATKRLKEVLGLRKTALGRRPGAKNQNGEEIKNIECELDVAETVREVCAEYEQQMEEMTEEIARLKEEVEAHREENFRSLMQDKEAECKAKDSELIDLRDQLKALSGLISQLHIRKPVTSQLVQQQVGLGQVSLSVGSNTESSDMDSIESRHLKGKTTAVVKNSSKICCSCSKKSSCKTLKCKCRANGGSCGPSCGCTSSKCANREAVSDTTYYSAETKSTESVTRDSLVEEAQTKAILASEGAVLLQNALAEKPDETNNIKGAERKPLTDVQNIARNASKPKQRKKGKAVRLVPVVPPSSQVEKETRPEKQHGEAV